MSAVTIAKIHISTGSQISELAAKITSQHQSSYPDDATVQTELVEAANEVLKMFSGQFEERLLPSALMQMQFCIKNYDTSGKKRRGVFRGAWFNKQKTPIPDRVKNFTRNILVFHTYSMSGGIPLAPKGWSL